MQHGLLFNVQKYSVQDGPGIRTTFFLKGCPLHCAWCHNPESISPAAELIFLENRCAGCEECRRVCPECAAGGAGPAPTRDRRCRLCGACVKACPAAARQIAGRRMSVPELLRIALQDRVFYEESGGGVTFSGGEPLLQAEFLLAALQACRGAGLHTAVDTSGAVPAGDLLASARFADLFLYDIKFADPERHRQFTGASNGRILENLALLAKAHQNVWLRVPVIPGVNARESEFRAIAEFARTLPGVRRVELLPYHRTGVPKWNRIGRTNRLPNLDSPSPGDMECALRLFESHGLSVSLPG